jgi:hypothetical protein
MERSLDVNKGGSIDDVVCLFTASAELEVGRGEIELQNWIRRGEIELQDWGRNDKTVAATWKVVSCQ